MVALFEKRVKLWNIVYMQQRVNKQHLSLPKRFVWRVVKPKFPVISHGSLITIIANTLPCFRVDVAQFRLVQGVPTNNPLFVCSSIIHLYLPTT